MVNEKAGLLPHCCKCDCSTTTGAEGRAESSRVCDTRFSILLTLLILINPQSSILNFTLILIIIPLIVFRSKKGF